MQIVLAAAQLFVGTFFLAITVAGFFKTDLPVWQRVLTFVAALGFISPDVITTVIAMIAGVVVLYLNVQLAKKAVKA